MLCEYARQHTDRVRAQGSGAGQKYDVDAFRSQPPRDFRSGLLQKTVVRRTLGAHEGETGPAEASDFAPRHEFACAVQGEHDVDVPLKGGAIEADAGMTLDDV